MAVIVVVWLLVDQTTKAYFGAFEEGVRVASPIPGVVDFTLVHNTGAAWGVLGDMTAVLGVVSAVVCALAIAYVVVVPDNSMLSVVGLSLVIAGGIGNVIDRFAHGYVIDFIDPAFIDFPVFNVADIGVTCGIVLFVASMVTDWFRAAHAEEKDDDGAA